MTLVGLALIYRTGVLKWGLKEQNEFDWSEVNTNFFGPDFRSLGSGETEDEIQEGSGSTSMAEVTLTDEKPFVNLNDFNAIDRTSELWKTIKDLGEPLVDDCTKSRLIYHYDASYFEPVESHLNMRQASFLPLLISYVESYCIENPEDKTNWSNPLEVNCDNVDKNRMGNEFKNCFKTGTSRDMFGHITSDDIASIQNLPKAKFYCIIGVTFCVFALIGFAIGFVCFRKEKRLMKRRKRLIEKMHLDNLNNSETFETPYELPKPKPTYI